MTIMNPPVVHRGTLTAEFQAKYGLAMNAVFWYELPHLSRALSTTPYSAYDWTRG